MRKLTVKNFSVIKEAELEFGKITVLIGPQASGKSLLCKLAYFLGREVIGIAESRIQQKFGFSDFEEAAKREFERWFPRSGWGRTNWGISFSSEGFDLHLSVDDTQNGKLNLVFGREFADRYGNGLALDYPDTLYTPAFELRGLGGNGVTDRFTYIPSERTYFVDTNKGYRSLASDPDPLSKAFAALYESSRNPDIPKPRMQRYLKGKLVRGDDAWLFEFDDGRTLPLSELSSGSKELMPLFSVLEMYEHQRPSTISSIRAGVIPTNSYNFDDFFIEEPEGHIFPDMQQELVRYFAELTNTEHFRPHFTITTHSPYILSAFNNLIEADQVAAAKPELKGEVANLIPQKYWIRQSDFKAYALENRVLKSIVAKDTGLVSSNYLDQVSETIGVEFDELLRLGYVES